MTVLRAAWYDLPDDSCVCVCVCARARVRVRVEFRFSDDDVNRSRAVARSGNTELCQHHHSKRGKYRALSLPLMHDERERCLFGTGFCSEGSALRAILAVPLLCFGYTRKNVLLITC